MHVEQGHAAWFRNFGGLAAGDDALPLISTDNKPYRKLIDSNSIPIFDFRIYLFARQATMLFHLGRVVEVAKRGAYFISTFARKLRENQVCSTVDLVSAAELIQRSAGRSWAELCRVLDVLGLPQRCRRVRGTH